jgi:hypothetical protein
LSYFRTNHRNNHFGRAEFDATREEVAAFFRNTAESSWVDVANTVAVFRLVALTWFMVGLCLLLRRAEGDPPWRSTVALVFGALFAAYLFTNASLQDTGNRGADIDPGLAHFAFDMEHRVCQRLGQPGYLRRVLRLGRSHDRDLPAVVGLADGGQRHRVGTESVCLDNEYLAAAVRTLLGSGHRGVHPTPQKTSMTILPSLVLAAGRGVVTRQLGPSGVSA